MGWLDHQDTGTTAKTKKVEVVAKEIEICLDNEHWIPVNKNCVDKICTDDMPRLLIVVDEIAELTGKSGIKTTEGKAEDALKDEILSNIQSITQLGRSAGIHCILCTQRNDATILPGVIQNNPLSLDTLVEVQDPLIDRVKAKVSRLFHRDVEKAA